MENQRPEEVKKPINIFAAAFLALLAFLVLVYNVGPAIVPYRDTGEFVTAAQHLNIAHPPGYPTYTLIARFWLDVIPWGSAAYRLNVLSALAAALSSALAFLFFVRVYGLSAAASLSAVLLLIFSQPVLSLSMVSEMYTAGLAFLLLILICVHTKRWPLAFFLFPLALGIRMDLALSAVYVLPLLLKKGEKERRDSLWMGHSLIFLFLGAAIFLYLPIRSAQGPMINWADPSSWQGFLESVTRRKYGSGVDLLSANYARGELFLHDFFFWIRRAWAAFGPLLLAAPLGIWVLKKKGRLACSLLCWTANVPLFLFLANMPLNPHAAQILQDHFIPGFVMVALWIAVGLDFFFRYRKEDRPWLSRAVSVGLPALLASWALFRCVQWSQRRNFYAHDYARNLFLSVPKDSILVLHEDVQLFCAWEAQRVRGKRKDLAIVGQGLSGTPWYQKNLREGWGYRSLILSTKLVGPQDWKNFMRWNASRPIAVGYETDAPVAAQPHGLARVLNNAEISTQPWALMVFRGSYRYERERLFFNQDLLEDYARAADTMGWRELRNKNYDSARRFFFKAVSFKFEFPFAYSGLGHLAFEKGLWQQAELYWQSCRRRFLHMLELAKRYKSLPGVMGAINADLAQTLVSLGVNAERLERPAQESLAFYLEASQRDPGNIQARYNAAATYWKLRDFPRARAAFESVLQIDPNHAQARHFLSLLKI